MKILTALFALAFCAVAHAQTPPSSLTTNHTAQPFPGKKSQWMGFDRYDFKFQGHNALVVAPKHPLPGKPWVWIGEFFGAFAQRCGEPDLAKKGFYLVYLRDLNTYGSPQTVKLWDAFYDLLTTQYGFAKKPALMGLSRGGLYCFNWAIANPDKVACIDSDSGVCDMKSWPGGKLQHLGTGNGSVQCWNQMKRVYGFKTQAQAIAYKGNPVDNLKPLADAHVPILGIYGTADTTVPPAENILVVAKRYRELGGNITLIAKPGVKHHPHGLKDPAQIVKFIEKYAGHPRQ